MHTINATLQEVQADVHHYTSLAQQGNTIIISEKNMPPLELKPKEKQKKIGTAKGNIEIPNSFFDPLPHDILEPFNNPK